MGRLRKKPEQRLGGLDN